MKVLHVINSLILAGAETLLKDVVLGLDARGLGNAVAVLKVLDSPLEHELQQAGIPFLALPESGIYSARHIAPLARHMEGFDLVHVHLFPAQLFAAMAARRIKHPPLLLTTEHGTATNRRRFWLRPIDRWLYRQYRLVACNSAATASSLSEWVPATASKTRVVPNGILVERFSNATAAGRQEVFQTPATGPLLISVARLAPPKDHATLLRALTRVQGTDLALVGDGELRPALQALARDLGIGERVHFLGRRADVSRLLKMADLFVHSSRDEGFGLAALEAMAAGVPVVATNVPGLAEVVGAAAVLTPPGDDAALAAAISSLLASPERRNNLSRAGRERAQQFSLDSTVEAYLRFYESALSSAPSR
jgi:glycosyltransferase involved in cell wall biosynthesis